MKRKASILIISYAAAAIVALGVYSAVSTARLNEYRSLADYSGERAFEETVYAVKNLSGALEKSLYAVDGGMCSRVCAQAYAQSQAAGAAMSVLPFSTHELEQISRFVGLSGDYAYTLAFEAAQEGFTDEQRQNLAAMSQTAAAFAEALEEYRGGLNGGVIELDRSEQRLANIDTDEKLVTLSRKLTEYESEFPALEELEYSGKYSATAAETAAQIPEKAARAAAAEFIGTDPGNLSLEYEASGSRRCYSADSLYICMNGERVESMASSRLVSQGKMSLDEAKAIAADFLKNRGLDGLELYESDSNGQLASFCFVCRQGDALCLENRIELTVALDNGKIYAYNAEKYSADAQALEWRITAEEAEGRVPAGLTLEKLSRVTAENAGGGRVACFLLSCTAEGGKKVDIYLDAETGEQFEIVPRS